MTDITELAQSLKTAATNVKETAHIARYLKATIARQTFKELMTPDNILALVEALEKAQRYIEELREWNADLAQESFERQQLISELEPIRAAAEKLVRCKGRYHSEQNYRALAALFGVKTPDLPPLDGESRAVTVENLQESAYRAGLTAGWNLGLANNNDGFNKCLAAHAAGIQVEAE
ncbi:ead/Ea22-like family protein [Klebsiella pneumoniae]|nr:ead/Ea22-like family protein [Klebsiella pneumoniae]HCF8388543.1 ead/Ea22-like family protein [Klebsiella pneumoniae]